MKGKTGKLLCIYACAAIAVLGLYAGLSRSRLSDFRLAARYSSSRAFEETVGAVGNLSLALRKSLYATDSGMCCRICSDVYADARAAETAMATLPFSTVEMARISGFLGVAGDYAYSLCPEAAANGFSDEQRSALYDMSAAAEEFAMALSEMQGSITDGTITMDTREVRIENVVGAIYISLVCILPEILVTSFQVQFYFGGTALLIVVGVALDTVRQIEDHLTNRHYDGFNAPTNNRPRLRKSAAAS